MSGTSLHSAQTHVSMTLASTGARPRNAPLTRAENVHLPLSVMCRAHPAWGWTASFLGGFAPELKPQLQFKATVLCTLGHASFHTYYSLLTNSVASEGS